MQIHVNQYYKYIPYLYRYRKSSISAILILVERIKLGEKNLRLLSRARHGTAHIYHDCSFVQRQQQDTASKALVIHGTEQARPGPQGRARQAAAAASCERQLCPTPDKSEEKAGLAPFQFRD
jgi:hypothetical protein